MLDRVRKEQAKADEDMVTRPLFPHMSAQEARDRSRPYNLNVIVRGGDSGPDAKRIALLLRKVLFHRGFNFHDTPLTFKKPDGILGQRERFIWAQPLCEDGAPTTDFYEVFTWYQLLSLIRATELQALAYEKINLRRPKTCLPLHPDVYESEIAAYPMLGELIDHLMSTAPNPIFRNLDLFPPEPEPYVYELLGGSDDSEGATVGWRYTRKRYARGGATKNKADEGTMMITAPPKPASTTSSTHMIYSCKDLAEAGSSSDEEVPSKSPKLLTIPSYHHLSLTTLLDPLYPHRSNQKETYTHGMKRKTFVMEVIKVVIRKKQDVGKIIKRRRL